MFNDIIGYKLNFKKIVLDIYSLELRTLVIYSSFSYYAITLQIIKIVVISDFITFSVNLHLKKPLMMYLGKNNKIRNITTAS